MRPPYSQAVVLAEGAALAVLGAGMLWLSFSEAYWSFLNPKFRPLTLAAGAVLLPVALAHPWGRSHGRRSSLASMLLFLGLSAWAVAGVVAGPDAGPDAGSVAPSAAANAASPTVLNGFDAGPPPDASPTFGDAPLPGPSRLEHAGREFVKLNLMELWMLAGDPDATPPERLALQGQAFPLAGETGRFALCRVAVTCCLADAVGVGFVVDGPLPPGVEEGGWVRLLGGLAPLAGSAPAPGEVRSPGVVMTLVHEQAMLRAESVEPAPPPGIPFMFDFRAEEPFAY